MAGSIFLKLALEKKITFFGIRSTPMLLQRYIKDPGHSAKSAGSKLQLNMHTFLTQRSQSVLDMPSRQSVGTHQENELTCNSSGNACPQSS